MPSIGDLANDIARGLYEFRIPLAVLSIAAAVAAVLVARRLGWFGAARRHPARTAVAIVAFLAVSAPLGWYLGSPIFIRTTLVEPPIAAAPIAASPSPSLGATPVPAPSATAATPTVAPTAPATSAPTPFDPIVHARGTFAGTDEFHFGRGTASIVEVEPGRFRIQLEEFSVRNGPDLYVYLSPDPDGYVKGSLEVGLLKATDGSFGYDLPPGFDPAAFESALIWCKQFSHLFAVASFGG